jgi:pSer/pThr/pTyr-binding forkhead associated (FHA) protein
VQPKLASLSGPLRNAEFLIGASLSIGSDLSNTICLVSPNVSARHCILSLQEGRCVLTDLESHSGSFVNGLPVKRRELKSGDHIAIGESVFLYQAEAQRQIAAVPYRSIPPPKRKPRYDSFTPRNWFIFIRNRWRRCRNRSGYPEI